MAGLAAVLQFLDAHNGAVIAIATIFYVVITLLLLGETRAGRVTTDVANLEAYPAPYGTVYVAVHLENYGPANARDVTLRLWLTIDNKTVDGTERVHVEPLYPNGRARTFLLHLKDGHIDSLNDLADTGAAVELRWSWFDSRARLFRGPIEHSRSRSFKFTKLREGFYGGHALIDKDPNEDLRKIASELAKVGRTLDGIKRKISERPAEARPDSEVVDVTVANGQETAFEHAGDVVLEVIPEATAPDAR